MKKSHVNAIIDALMLISMLIVVFIGILLGFFIGRGSVSPAEKYLWGLHRHDWGDLHLIFSLILVGLVALHFVLHLNWVAWMSKACLRLHWGLTMAILVILSAGILYGSMLLKRSSPGRWEREEHGRGYGGRGQSGQFEEGKGLRGGQGRRPWDESDPDQLHDPEDGFREGEGFRQEGGQGRRGGRWREF